MNFVRFDYAALVSEFLFDKHDLFIETGSAFFPFRYWLN